MLSNVKEGVGAQFRKSSVSVIPRLPVVWLCGADDQCSAGNARKSCSGLRGHGVPSTRLPLNFLASYEWGASDLGAMLRIVEPC